MKIQFKYEFKDRFDELQSSVSVESYEESLPEIIQTFRNFLLAIGFQPESVNEYIEEN